MGRKVLGYWRCSNCGSENPGNVKVCPHCSHPHGDEAFYVGSQDDPSRPLHYVEEGSAEYERAKKPPQWRCGYCGSMNDADVRICRGCSHPRDGEDNDYFDLHPERRDHLVDIAGNEIGASSKSNEDDHHHPFAMAPPTSTSDWTPEELDNGLEEDDSDSFFPPEPTRLPTFDIPSSSRPPIAAPRRRHNFSFSPLPTVTGFFTNLPWGRLGIGLAIIASIACLIFLLIPKEATLTVTDIDWQRQIEIEEYRTVRESDWSIPAGGRYVSQREEYHHTDHRLDHYETAYKTRRVWVGSHEEVVGYKDLGNGYFEEETRTVDDYEDETYTEQEPVYVDVPVYETKYTYDIERWVHDHTEKSSGHDHRPYWPDVVLKEQQRTGWSSETYGLTAINENVEKKKSGHYTVSFSDWQNINVGDQIHAKIHFGGYIEILDMDATADPMDG